METPSPNIRGRARKPNFTNEEIDCLLELVYQSRVILLSNNHKAHNMRHKQVIWQQIADDVTLNGDRLCQRDATDVRQKWKDLLRMAKQDMNAVETARKNNSQIPPVSPYSNRVIQIKTGTPLFTDPSEDIHGGDFFGAISLMDNGSGDKEMGDVKRHPDGLEGVDADNNELASTSGWDQHADQSKLSSNKPYFSANEIRSLITLYDKQKSILQDDTNDATTTTQKLEAWKFIAENVSQAGTDRTSAECQQKWHKFVAQAKKEEHMENEEAEKGCSFPKSQFTDLILKVDRTEEEIVESMGFADEFWDSLEDNTEELSNNGSATMAELIDDDETLRTLCNLKKESIDENEDGDMMKEANGEHDGDCTTPTSSSTPAPTSVVSRPLKRTLSPKASRPDLLRKRKRPLSGFINSSRHQMLHSARTHTVSDFSVSLNHHKEKQELENRKLRLEVERLELENALMRSQQEKVELEKEKLRLEMDKLEQEKEKVNMEKEMIAVNVQVLSQKLETYEN